MKIRITDDQSDYVIDTDGIPQPRLGYVGTRVVESMLMSADITTITITRMPGSPIRTTTYTRVD